MYDCSGDYKRCRGETSFDGSTETTVDQLSVYTETYIDDDASCFTPPLSWWHRSTKRRPLGVTTLLWLTAASARTRHLATNRRWSSPLCSASDGLLFCATAAAEQSIPSLRQSSRIRPSNTVCRAAGSRKDSSSVRLFVSQRSTSAPVSPSYRRCRKVVALRSTTVLNASALDWVRTEQHIVLGRRCCHW